MVLAAGTNVGKTLVKCHLAASWIKMGYNVLYITCEMAEEKIAERIDANLMNFAVNDLKKTSKTVFMSKMNDINTKVSGRLYIKEYPTATVNVNHMRHLLEELSIKKSFSPDIVIVDYINICRSVRYRNGSNTNSYEYNKAIAEELRGLAVERNLAIVSSTQFNREGMGSSDPEITNISESMGVAFTADLTWAIVSNEDMYKTGQIMFKQLKNRFDEMGRKLRFFVDIERSKMRLTNSNSNNPTSGMGSPMNPTPVPPASNNSSGWKF
jgi:hypothetical protein